jgi:hypothetical protein
MEGLVPCTKHCNVFPWNIIPNLYSLCQRWAEGNIVDDNQVKPGVTNSIFDNWVDEFQQQHLAPQKLGLLNSQLEKFHFSCLLSEIYIVSVSNAYAYDCCRCQTSFWYLSFTVCTWLHWWLWHFEYSIWSDWLFNEWKTTWFPLWFEQKDVYLDLAFHLWLVGVLGHPVYSIYHLQTTCVLYKNLGHQCGYSVCGFYG